MQCICKNAFSNALSLPPNFISRHVFFSTANCISVIVRMWGCDSCLVNLVPAAGARRLTCQLGWNQTEYKVIATLKKIIQCNSGGMAITEGTAGLVVLMHCQVRNMTSHLCNLWWTTASEGRVGINPSEVSILLRLQKGYWVTHDQSWKL